MQSLKRPDRKLSLRNFVGPILYADAAPTRNASIAHRQSPDAAGAATYLPEMELPPELALVRQSRREPKRDAPSKEGPEKRRKDGERTDGQLSPADVVKQQIAEDTAAHRAAFVLLHSTHKAELARVVGPDTARIQLTRTQLKEFLDRVNQPDSKSESSLHSGISGSSHLSLPALGRPQCARAARP